MICYFSQRVKDPYFYPVSFVSCVLNTFQIKHETIFVFQPNIFANEADSNHKHQDLPASKTFVYYQPIFQDLLYGSMVTTVSTRY